MCCPIAEMRITMRHYSVVAFILLACIDSCIAFSQPVSAVPFQNISIPVEKRVDYLISRMTLEERYRRLPTIPRPFHGSIFRHIAGHTSACMALHGQVMRHSILKPIAWRLMDAEFVDRESDVISTKARAKVQRGSKARCSFDLLLDELLVCKYKNFPRSPGGRGQETYGEDPFPADVLLSPSLRAYKARAPIASWSSLRPSTSPSIADQNRSAIALAWEPSPHTIIGTPTRLHTFTN